MPRGASACVEVVMEYITMVASCPWIFYVGRAVRTSLYSPGIGESKV
jgi:hypothetical protein